MTLNDDEKCFTKQKRIDREKLYQFDLDIEERRDVVIVFKIKKIDAYG